MRTHWRLKLTMTATLAVLLNISYFVLHFASPFDARALPLTRVDDWAGFAPAWAWVYVTLYLALVVIPWLAMRRVHIRLFARGVVWMVVASGLVFFLYPVAGPRPQGVSGGVLYDLLVTVDPPTNAMPSMHIALATFLIAFAGRAVIRRRPRLGRRLTIAALWGWVAVLAWSTMATKQHYFVDVVAGFLLGLAVHVGMRRWRRRVIMSP